MRTTDVVCDCNEVIVKSIDGVTKIRSKVLIVKGNTAYAICKNCSEEVVVPLSLNSSDANPPLILRVPR